MSALLNVTCFLHFLLKHVVVARMTDMHANTHSVRGSQLCVARFKIKISQEKKECQTPITNLAANQQQN